MKRVSQTSTKRRSTLRPARKQGLTCSFCGSKIQSKQSGQGDCYTNHVCLHSGCKNPTAPETQHKHCSGHTQNLHSDCIYNHKLIKNYLPVLPVACASCCRRLSMTDRTWCLSRCLDLAKFLQVELFMNSFRIKFPNDTLIRDVLCAFSICLNKLDDSYVVRWTVFGTIRLVKYLNFSIAQLGIPDGSIIDTDGGTEEEERELEKEMSSEDIFLTPGLPVKFQLWNSEKTFKGEVVQDLALLRPCDKAPDEQRKRREFVRWVEYPGSQIETLLLDESCIKVNEKDQDKAMIHMYDGKWHKAELLSKEKLNVNDFVVVKIPETNEELEDVATRLKSEVKIIAPEGLEGRDFLSRKFKSFRESRKKRRCTLNKRQLFSTTGHSRSTSHSQSFSSPSASFLPPPPPPSLSSTLSPEPNYALGLSAMAKQNGITARAWEQPGVAEAGNTNALAHHNLDRSQYYDASHTDESDGDEDEDIDVQEDRPLVTVVEEMEERLQIANPTSNLTMNERVQRLEITSKVYQWCDAPRRARKEELEGRMRKEDRTMAALSKKIQEELKMGPQDSFLSMIPIINQHLFKLGDLPSGLPLISQIWCAYEEVSHLRARVAILQKLAAHKDNHVAASSASSSSPPLSSLVLAQRSFHGAVTPAAAESARASGVTSIVSAGSASASFASVGVTNSGARTTTPIEKVSALEVFVLGEQKTKCGLLQRIADLEEALFGTRTSSVPLHTRIEIAEKECAILGFELLPYL